METEEKIYEVGLGQADWFTNNLCRHFPDLIRQQTNDTILQLTAEKYMALKRLYFRAFATSISKPGDPVAAMQLEMELEKLKLLS